MPTQKFIYLCIYLLYLTLQLSISQPATLKPKDTDALDMPDTAFRGFYYLSRSQQELTDIVVLLSSSINILL